MNFKSGKIRVSKSFKASDRIKKRDDVRKNVARAIKIAIILVVFIAPILVLRADFLKIKDITILGREDVDSSPVKNVVQDFIQGSKFLFLPKSNLLLLNKDDLAGVILTKFSNIEEVYINKRFDKTLEVSIKERSADFVWCDLNQECFHMTKTGLIFNKVEAIVEDKLIFRGRIEGDPIMKNFATTEEMQKYSDLIGLLTKSDLKVLSFNIESEDKMVVETDIASIFFNIEDKNIKESLEGAILLIKDQRAKNPSVYFQYIDARFGSKLFYKVR